MSKITNYIFDLDGTIMDSSKEVIECMYRAFIEANYPVDKSRLTSNLIGPPLKEIVQNIAPEIKDDNKICEIMANFGKIYDNDENDISEVYEGVYDVLDKLKKDGCKLFLATFKPSAPTFRIVKQFKLNYFEDVYTIDKFDKHITKDEMISDILEKYALKKDETVMVGDALSDINAAKKAGVKAIGALWGYGDDKKPLIENADEVINSIEELCQK